MPSTSTPSPVLTFSLIVRVSSLWIRIEPRHSARGGFSPLACLVVEERVVGVLSCGVVCLAVEESFVALERTWSVSALMGGGGRKGHST